MRWPIWLFVAFLLFSVGYLLKCNRGLYGDLTEARSHLEMAVLDNETMLAELKRDEEIFITLFGEWDRSRPVLHTQVSVTCYTSRPEETDDSPHWTADGSLVRRGIIAVSRDLLDEFGLFYGQRVFLAGYGVYVVRDTMNPRWRRRVDIWTGDLRAAKLHGKRENVAMLWLGRG